MKCTKTYNARAEQLFLLINPIVLWRSRCRRCRRHDINMFHLLSGGTDMKTRMIEDT